MMVEMKLKSNARADWQDGKILPGWTSTHIHAHYDEKNVPVGIFNI